MSSEDRRAPGATRTPFDGLVEVGGALGPSFEAQAVNVSEDGIHLRTAYLPELGQPLTCRFDGGPNKSVLVAGEVVWSQGEAKGGEFGVRFTEMDAESVDALKGLCGVGGSPPQVQAGSKVRLHIEGLASPMRAKIKDSHPTEVTVGSDLGFLQVGKQLELEDAQNGGKRPACIDRVEVAVDPDSNVPQLVVTLRYSDVEARVDASRGAAPTAEARPQFVAPSDDLAAVEEASRQMKGALARNIARIGPAFERFARRATTTVALMAQRRAARVDDGGAARRTTSLPPGGGLHASGRRVVRGESSPGLQPSTPEGAPKLQVTKRKAIVAGAVMMAAIAGALVLKTAHHETDGGAKAAESATSPAPAGSSESTGGPAPVGSTTLGATAPPAEPGPSPAASPAAGLAAADDGADSAQGLHKKHARVAPFGNGPVHHGNVLRLKMDSAIDSLEGAQQPTGFAVKIPGRRSLEAAGPLAARDSRIAAIKISNDPAGAELTVAFKDGVPNYLVSARGDTLVIALAPPGSPDKLAKKDDRGAKSSKHSKHEKKKGDAN
jgi:hypothetical protein